MIYVRMYETEQQARDVVGKLEEDGFPAETIFLVTSASGDGEAAVGSIKAAMAAGFVLGSDAEVYIQGVERGRSLVLIQAGFGHGQSAVNILDSGGPVETDLLPPPRLSVDYDEAAPLSSAFQWSVLKRDEPAPLSAWLGLQPITSSSLLNRSFGFPLLNNKAAPLSSLFGLKTLSAKTDPGEASFGLPLLLADPAPLSSKFGLPLLTSQG